MDGPAWALHPAFEPYRRWVQPVDAAPSVATLDGLARAGSLALADGRALRFAPLAGGRHGALEYERRIATEGEIAAREGSWHDAFNALAWLAFPRAKAAINALHCRHGEHGSANRRDRARDAATLLDESGMVVACPDAAFPALLRRRAWREAFVARRHDAGACALAVIGHGLLDKLRRPYPAITAHVLVVDLAPDAARAPGALDAAAADAVADARFGPSCLLPVPVCAWPGWDADGAGDARFDDASVFRTSVLRSTR